MIVGERAAQVVGLALVCVVSLACSQSPRPSIDRVRVLADPRPCETVGIAADVDNVSQQPALFVWTSTAGAFTEERTQAPVTTFVAPPPPAGGQVEGKIVVLIDNKPVATATFPIRIVSGPGTACAPEGAAAAPGGTTPTAPQGIVPPVAVPESQPTVPAVAPKIASFDPDPGRCAPRGECRVSVAISWTASPPQGLHPYVLVLPMPGTAGQSYWVQSTPMHRGGGQWDAQDVYLGQPGDRPGLPFRVCAVVTGQDLFHGQRMSNLPGGPSHCVVVARGGG